MTSITQIQRGFVKFVDAEVAPAFEGWQKAVVAGTAGLLASNFPNLVKTYGSHPLVAALGIYDSSSGCVNIDALYDAFVPKMGMEKIPIAIPKIGTIRMGRDEIDTLIMYIKEA